MPSFKRFSSGGLKATKGRKVLQTVHVRCRRRPILLAKQIRDRSLHGLRTAASNGIIRQGESISSSGKRNIASAIYRAARWQVYITSMSENGISGKGKPERTERSEGKGTMERRKEHQSDSVQGLYKNWLCCCIHSDAVWLRTNRFLTVYASYRDVLKPGQSGNSECLRMRRRTSACSQLLLL